MDVSIQRIRRIHRVRYGDPQTYSMLQRALLTSSDEGLLMGVLHREGEARLLVELEARGVGNVTDRLRIAESMGRLDGRIGIAPHAQVWNGGVGLW